MAEPTASTLTTKTQLADEKPFSATSGFATPPNTQAPTMTNARTPSGKASTASTGTAATSNTRACQPEAEIPAGGVASQPEKSATTASSPLIAERFGAHRRLGGVWDGCAGVLGGVVPGAVVPREAGPSPLSPPKFAACRRRLRAAAMASATS